MEYRLPHPDLDAARQALTANDRRETTRLDIAINSTIFAELGTSEDLSVLSEPRRNWHLCAQFEGETNGGGLGHYLGCASDGEYAEDAVSALRFFGATVLADILSSALQLIPNEVRQSGYDSRVEWLDDQETDLFDDLDKRFFPVGTSEIERLAYAVANPSEFFQQ